MINTIQINDYQSHRKTELNLSPGINVIVGENDKGKSAILRALNWLVNNRPLGEGYIYNKLDKKEEKEVRVFVSDEHWNIARIKNIDKDFNGYFLQHKKDSELSYEFDKI